MNTECVSTSDTCLFKRHLLYDVRNAFGTLASWKST